MKNCKLPNGKTIFSLDKMSAIDVYKEIYEENVYLRSGIHVKPVDVVFDAGANIGLFSMYISEKVEDLKIYAFEPIPQIFEALQANLKNNSAIVKLYNVGLSDQEKNVEFNFYPRVSADSTSTPFVFKNQVDMFAAKYSAGIVRLVPEKIKRWFIARTLKHMYTPIKVTCPLKTLSQIIAENQVDRIDLLKLDAENAERQVLDGINEEDWGKIRQISMEVHTNIPGGETLVSYLINLLESKGFKYELDTNSRFSDFGVHMLYAKK